MLLEAAVYPYLIASLLHGLSSMAPDRAWRLFKNGWPLYLLVWGVTFGLLGLLSQAIPHPLPASMGTGTTTLFRHDTALDSAAHSERLLHGIEREQRAPPVVVFCIAFGTALQQMKDKQALLGILDRHPRGQLRVLEFRRAHGAHRGLLAACRHRRHDSPAEPEFARAVPVSLLRRNPRAGVLGHSRMLGRRLTPLKYGEVIGNLRSGLILALITTLPASAPFHLSSRPRAISPSAAASPMLIATTLLARISPSRTPLGQLGNFFVYLYILFAAFACGQAIPAAEQVFLPLMTLLSCFGTPASSVKRCHLHRQLVQSSRQRERSLRGVDDRAALRAGGRVRDGLRLPQHDRCACLLRQIKNPLGRAGRRARFRRHRHPRRRAFHACCLHPLLREQAESLSRLHARQGP